TNILQVLFDETLIDGAAKHGGYRERRHRRNQQEQHGEGQPHRILQNEWYQSTQRLQLARRRHWCELGFILGVAGIGLNRNGLVCHRSVTPLCRDGVRNFRAALWLRYRDWSGGRQPLCPA